ncbi:DUF6988 family protein [Ideonella paludis]|uniref:Uncharacterized protein n=1 Tax=Ideonella paludis TaxID=1233411 RepID=A0ABS5DX00_9BURK|nr:hypothetical protein [Ideonella paludis]MBQ0935679.1 hypothetical protein [Ideonella paludis]
MVSKLATEDELKSMLEQSWALDEDLTQLMAALPDPVNRRQTIVRGMASTSHSHYRSQRALMEIGTTPTILALVRLHYESVIRSLWYATGATDDWIDRMTLENSKENGEPVMGPPVDAMLKRLDEVLPPHVSASLRVLKDASWKPMNSFVHGGLHAILTGLFDAYTPYHCICVLKNANGLALMNTQSLVIVCNQKGTRGLIAALQQRHMSCLPE